MTVGELKEILEEVPDHVEITALKDGVYCERSDVWYAGYDKQEDENGDIEERFTINC